MNDVDCHEVRVALAVWSGHVDLPETVAGHLGDCVACRARFDERFPVVPIRPVPVDPAVRERLLGRSRSPVAGALVLAAAAMVVVGLSTTLPRTEVHAADLAELVPPVCADDVWEPQLLECPLG